LILFDDQSSIGIKTESAAAVSPDLTVKSVYESGDEFGIVFDDGSSATLQLADPGSSVAVRDRNNVVEHLGYFPWAGRKFQLCLHESQFEKG